MGTQTPEQIDTGYAMGPRGGEWIEPMLMAMVGFRRVPVDRLASPIMLYTMVVSLPCLSLAQYALCLKLLTQIGNESICRRKATHNLESIFWVLFS
jgi:hypothetical protein